MANMFFLFISASLYVSVIFLAIIINSTIPLYFEVTVEGTYPVAEGITAMIMTWLNNFYGLLFLLVMLDNSIGKSLIFIMMLSHGNVLQVMQRFMA